MLVMILGVALIFGSLFIVFALVGTGSGEKRGVSRSLEVLEAMTNAPAELTAELDPPFSERVMAPLLARTQSMGKRITGADQVDRIRHALDRAGNPHGWTVDRVASMKIIGAAGGLGFGIFLWFLMGLGLAVAFVVVAACTVLGFFGVNIFLYNIATKRDALMQKALADAIDLLTISVEAGLGFDAALQQVARNTEGPLAAEFARVLQEMQIGRGRMESMRAMADRTGMADLRSFVSAMVQADSFGIPIAQVLRVQSQEIRIKRRQRAEEKAAQVPVKIMIPVVLFVLPCLFIVVLGPAAISIVEAF